LHLSFGSPSLRNICESKGAAIRTLGESAALQLRIRISDIVAAETVDDLPLPSIKQDGYLDVSLGTSHYIRLQQGHSRAPITDAGVVDWSKVTRLKVTYIGTDHD